MKNALTVIRNTFHGTEYYSKKTTQEVADILERIQSGRATRSDRAFASRSRNKLCGATGCECSENELGERN